ncbi:putative transcription factor interactor and regulator FHA-SMAD family [Helianthus debilis subsp. tardiflorus]
MATVSSPWIPEDDLLLKNSIEAGASLEALAKGAVNFSHRYTLREIRDRWYSLLYDPDVSTQASARMAELELSGSNPTSKFRLDSLKGSENVHDKRKTGSIRRHYHTMRKRLKNELFSSQNLGFFEERNHHNYNHQGHKFQDTTHGGDAMLDDCLANNLGFEEKDFEILRRAFPESLTSISTTATTTTTAAIVENPADAFHKSVQTDFINGSINVPTSRNELMVKSATCIDESGPSGPSETLPNEKQTKNEKSVFGGKQYFNSPISDGSASFHTMGGFSSPSTRQPIWKTMEDISAPDMPVDDNNAESHQVTKETSGCDGPHQVSLLGDSELIGSIGVQEGEYTDLPESLLNFSNEDDILFMDVDAKDTVDEDVQEVDLPDAATSSVASPNVEIPGNQCPEDLKDSAFLNNQHGVCHQELTEGQIICTLNREDPDIPCNDDIFLLIHPSTQFAPSVGLQIATDSIGPLSSSSHEKDGEQGPITVRKGKDPAPSFSRSLTGGPTALPAFKRESPDGEYVGPLPGKPNNLRIPSQTRPVHTPLVIGGNGILEENASKVEPQGLGSPAMYNEMPLPLEAGTIKMIDPESMGDSFINDNNSDSDGDIPYFSDVEAMILEMDLAHGPESSFTSEVARYQFEDAKKMIMRLEQAARSSFQRAMSSQGALAIFYGRRLKQYIKKSEVTIGRSTDDTEVDIDLRKEGRANKISRRQAIIKMDTDGSFSLKNLGASSISINGKTVAHGQLVALASSCLIEIRGMSFVFEINDKYVRRLLDNQTN